MVFQYLNTDWKKNIYLKGWVGQHIWSLLKLDDGTWEFIDYPFYFCECWKSSRMRSLRGKKVTCTLFFSLLSSAVSCSRVPHSMLQRKGSGGQCHHRPLCHQDQMAHLLLLSLCSSGDFFWNILSLMSLEPACPGLPLPHTSSTHSLASTNPLNASFPQEWGLVLSFLVLHTLICSPDSGSTCPPAWWAWLPGVPQSPHTYCPTWSPSASFTKSLPSPYLSNKGA